MPTKRELRDMLHVAHVQNEGLRERLDLMTDAWRQAIDERDTALADIDASDIVTAERASARTLSVRLEQENAQLRAALTASVEGFSDVSIELRLAAIAMHQILAAGQA